MTPGERIFVYVGAICGLLAFLGLSVGVLHR